MKKYFHIYLIFLLGLLSCEKYMHTSEVDLSDLTEVDRMEQALNGMYNRLAHMHQYFYFHQIIKGDDITYHHYNNRAEASLLNDNPIPVDSNGNLVFHQQLNTSGGASPHFSNSDQIELMIWQNIYSTIIAANNIIRQEEIIDSDSPAWPYIIEAYFVRAYCYYNLIRIFGRVPLVQSTDVDYNLSIATPQETFTLIESDLQTAIRHLPGSNQMARIPYATPHQGTAKSLLAEVYLCMGGYPINDISKYSSAAQLAGEVINNAIHFGYALLPDFAALWSSNLNLNSESVFSIFYKPNLSGGNTITHLEHTFQLPSESLDLNFTKENNIIVEVNFYNSIRKDYRRDVTFINHLTGFAVHAAVDWVFYPELGEWLMDTLGVYNFDHYYDTIGLADNIALSKHHVQNTTLPIGGSNRQNTVLNHPDYNRYIMSSLYVLRYAHVLLCYAEAKARTGELDEMAFEALNQVRRRANLADIYSPSEYDISRNLSPQQFADSVVAERAWEFCGEYEGRWFDLIRLEMVENLRSMRHPGETGFPQYDPGKEDYYLPIPEQELAWFE